MAPAITTSEVKRSVYARDGYLYIRNIDGTYKKVLLDEVAQAYTLASELSNKVQQLESALAVVTKILDAVVPRKEI